MIQLILDAFELSISLLLRVRVLRTKDVGSNDGPCSACWRSQFPFQLKLVPKVIVIQPSRSSPYCKSCPWLRPSKLESYGLSFWAHQNNFLYFFLSLITQDNVIASNLAELVPSLPHSHSLNLVLSILLLWSNESYQRS